MLDFCRRVTKYRGPCSTFRTEAEFLIRLDVPFGFWGHDSAMELSFFVSGEALKRLQPAMAIVSRKKVFDMVASDDILFAGAHLRFPGLGHAAKALSGCTYVPLPHAEHL